MSLPPSNTCALCSRPVSLAEIGKGMAVLELIGLVCWVCLRDGVKARTRVTRTSPLEDAA